MYFRMKSTLKSNHYHTFKHPLSKLIFKSPLNSLSNPRYLNLMTMTDLECLGLIIMLDLIYQPPLRSGLNKVFKI